MKGKQKQNLLFWKICLKGKSKRDIESDRRCGCTMHESTRGQLNNSFLKKTFILMANKYLR